MQPQSQSSVPNHMASSPGGASVALLLEAIAPVLVEDGGEFSFAGAITRREAQSGLDLAAA